MNHPRVFDFSAFPTLTTDRLILREPLSSDAADVFVFRSDPVVQKYNAEPMTEVSQAVDFIERMRSQYNEQKRILWAATMRDGHKVIGLVGFGDWDRHHRRAMLGYDFDRAYWGRGFGSESVRALIRFGFEQMQLNRIEAPTIVDNVESVHLLEKLGFQREGIRREYSYEDDGAFHDSAMYGLLCREYQP